MLNANVNRLAPTRRARTASAAILLIATVVCAGYGTAKASAANPSLQPARPVESRVELKIEPTVAETRAANPIKTLTASAASMGQAFFRFAGSILDATGRPIPGTQLPSRIQAAVPAAS